MFCRKSLVGLLFCFGIISISINAMERDIVMEQLPFRPLDVRCETFSQICQRMSQLSTTDAYHLFMHERRNLELMDPTSFQHISALFDNVRNGHLPQGIFLNALCTLKDEDMINVQAFIHIIGLGFVDLQGNNILQIVIDSSNLELLEWLLNASDHFSDNSKQSASVGGLCPFDAVVFDNLLKR